MSKAPPKTVWVTKTGATPKTHPVPGIRAIYHPLLVVEPAPVMPAPPGHKDILIFTSRNGVEHFCALSDRRHWQVLTVGDATAQTAQQEGFSDIQSAGKDVDALIALISQSIAKNTPLYYASAADISGDLPGELKGLGYTVTRAVFYETMPNPTPLDHHADYIFIYSQKGAKALRDSGLISAKTTLVSISKSVDSAMGKMAVKARKWAEMPNHKSMLKLLDRP